MRDLDLLATADMLEDQLLARRRSSGNGDKEDLKPPFML
jgi:hypothetical protein